MCGFAGILFSTPVLRDVYHSGLDGFRNAAQRLAHRGDTDYQERLEETLWLAHHRLAFQDVSAGIQPMLSHDGQHVIVFNGEVYNHLELRKTIQQQRRIEFKTRSDTETIIEGWKTFGKAFFRQLEGEYAFVIASPGGDYLIAHRDHYGVKPLYLYIDGVNTRAFDCYRPDYHFTTARLEFASEVKGLTASKTWNRDGLLRQFCGLFEPVCTPFENIIHVPAGGVLEAARTDAQFQCSLSTHHFPVRDPRIAPASIDESAFEAALHASVEDRLLSDVELGVYLSGGIDSKAVAFELARLTQTGGKLKSFTLGFAQQGYDETDEALRFSRHLGFDPHVMRIDDAALNYSYPLAVQASELVQPFTNGAAKWWLSLFAREYVQGVLTGDGADEVLCGYPSFRYANWWKHVMRARGRARSVRDVNELLDRQPLGIYKRDGLYLGRYSAHAKNPWLAGSSAQGNGRDFIDSLNMWGVPHPLFGQVQTIAQALLGAREADAWLAQQAQSIRSWYAAGLDGIESELANPVHALLLWQNYFVKAHLPVLILNWVGDRMEMANTLEGRTPFMSRRLFEFMYRQPDRALVHGLRDKILLRRSYARLFPREFAMTPKKQFNAPFINNTALIEQFHTQEIFQTTGLADRQRFAGLLERINTSQESDAYLAAHLNSVQQTAISLSIVQRSIVENRPLPRDRNIEDTYLSRGGQCELPV